MNLTSLKELNDTQLESIIDISIQIKKDPLKYKDVLADKKMYMLFEKTSTRTALAFGMGFNEMGGIYFTQRWEDSNFTVGEIGDETRYVARNVDLILARLKQNQDIDLMGKTSPIPVINGCCNRYHPTQALADCMTVKELFGDCNRTLVYFGVWNNVFNSLTLSLPRLGGKVIGICPIINDATISGTQINELLSSNVNIEYHDGLQLSKDQLKQIVAQADIVYTDTWVDMEFFNNPEFKELKEERIRLMQPFSVTEDLLSQSRARVMHDMPIHAGYEIERNVCEQHMPTILLQAENRRHVAKGIFCQLLGITI